MLAQAVQQRVSGFVRDHLVRQAGEDLLFAVERREISKEESLCLLSIKSVRVAKSMGRDLDLMAAEAPSDSPSHGIFEACQGLHNDRVDHAGMEGRTGQQVPVSQLLEG